MRQLFDDFMSQSWAMEIIIAWGWLSVVIMAASFVENLIAPTCPPSDMWLSSLTEDQREALLGLAHNVIVSDGLLDPNEEWMLDEFKREMELHPNTEAEYLELEGIEQTFDSRRARIVALLEPVALELCRRRFRDRGRVFAQGGWACVWCLGRGVFAARQLGTPADIARGRGPLTNCRREPS